MPINTQVSTQYQSLYEVAGDPQDDGLYKTSKIDAIVAQSSIVPRKVMASPPTVALNPTATITTPLLWPAKQNISGNTTAILGNPAFTVYGSDTPALLGTTYPQYLFMRYLTQFVVSFMHTGSAFEYLCEGLVGGALLARVDGEFVSLTPQITPSDGGLKYWFFDFGSVGTRRIDIFCSGFCGFGGINTAQTDSITPVNELSPKVVIVGDSFTYGTSSDLINNWAKVFGHAMGWTDVYINGRGGTGFVATNSGADVNYFDRIGASVVARNPDVVIFQGSINDATASPVAVREQAKKCFEKVSADLPSCLIVATSPMATGGVNKVGLNAWGQRIAIKEEVEKVGGIFIDLLEIPSNNISTIESITCRGGAAINATTIPLEPGVSAIPGVTYSWGNGYRTRCKTYAPHGTTPSMTIDAGVQGAISADDTGVAVGGSLWTGTGRVGATTGFGNSDIIVYSDASHPTPDGHLAIGTEIANQLIGKLKNK